VAENEEADKRAQGQLEDIRRLLAPTPDFSKLASPSVDFEKLVGPNVRSLASIARQIERTSSLLKSPSALAGLDRAFRIPDYTKNLIDSPAFRAFQEQSTSINKMARAIESSSLHLREMGKLMERSALGLKLPESAFEQFQKSALVWDSGLSEAVRRFSETNLSGLRADLCSRLLEPSQVFSRFAAETASRIQALPDARSLRALNASLALADAQHLANVDTLCEFVTSVADDGVISTPRFLESPFIQQAELLGLTEIDDEEDVDHLVSLSPTAQTTEQSRTVLNLSMSCNKASCLKGKGDIFKPTTRLMEVYSDLPWLAPRDERAFGDFVDCLYFLLYEGAGKDKLRYLLGEGGPLNKDECQIVWCVKILRNKWLRHDVDHGKESDIRRSWNDLDTHLNWLGFSGYPHTASDFQRLHQRLLQEAEAFLNLLLGKFR
jgi:hypothetical protein